jgi:hypothetical protein
MMPIKQKKCPFNFIFFKFVKIFNTSTTNITKVDWDEIELTTNKLVVENNHIMHGHFSKS